jgi:hypothetical protein
MTAVPSKLQTVSLLTRLRIIPATVPLERSTEQNLQVQAGSLLTLLVSTEVGSPPQSAVYLPGEGFNDPGATLTYDEWKAQRDELGTIVSSQNEGYIVPSVAGSKVFAPVYDRPAMAEHGGSYHVSSRRSQQSGFQAAHGLASTHGASAMQAINLVHTDQA